MPAALLYLVSVMDLIGLAVLEVKKEMFEQSGRQR